MTEFSVDISKWAKKTEKNIDRFMLEFTQDLAEEVVTNTPVDTGFLRASWTATVNIPDISTEGAQTGGNAEQASSQALTRMTANLIGVKGGDTVYYTNNANYGIFVEYGTSRFEGRAFVRNAVSKAGTLAKNAARRVT